MEWIECAERLPEIQDEYLIFFNGNLFLSIFSFGEWNTTCYCFACQNQKFDPSHWMKIKKPEE